MDQLAKIRLERHQEYLRQTWLPLFFDKYKCYFDQKYRASSLITKTIKKYMLPNVINDEMVEHIPGLYRFRVHLSNNNLNKPIHIVEDIKPGVPIINEYHDEIVIALKKSLKEHDELCDKEFAQVIDQSMQDMAFEDYDEYVFKQIIIESGKSLEVAFYYCIDLRLFSLNFNQAIYVDNIEYYIDTEQINKIKILWDKINPDTNTGIKYHQNLEYQKSLSQDMDKSFF